MFQKSHNTKPLRLYSEKLTPSGVRPAKFLLEIFSSLMFDEPIIPLDIEKAQFIPIISLSVSTSTDFSWSYVLLYPDSIWALDSVSLFYLKTISFKAGTGLRNLKIPTGRILSVSVTVSWPNFVSNHLSKDKSRGYFSLSRSLQFHYEGNFIYQIIYIYFYVIYLFISSVSISKISNRKSNYSLRYLKFI